MPEVKEISVTINDGDTLSSLAREHLGDGSKWRTIYTQISDSVSNPDLIMSGQTVTFMAYE